MEIRGRKKNLITIMFLATVMTLFYAGAAFANEDAILEFTKNSTKAMGSVLALVVIVIGVVLIVQRHIGAALSLIFAAVIIYAAANTTLISVVAETLAGYFGAKPN